MGLQLPGSAGVFLKRACDYLADQNGWNIIAMETDKDHIHILLEYDTTERICDIISRQHTIFGYVTKHFFQGNTGRNVSFGQTDILPVVLAKSLQQLSKSI